MCKAKELRLTFYGLLDEDEAVSPALPKECARCDRGQANWGFNAVMPPWLAARHFLSDNEWVPRSRPRPLPFSMAELQARLLAQPRELLVGILVQHAERDAPLRERLLLLASAAPTTPGPMDIDAMERVVRRAIEIEGNIDYRGAGLYAIQVEKTLDAIEHVLASDQRQHALRLVDTAVDALDCSMSNVDDSGELNDALEQLKNLHVRACAAAELEPKKLARKMFERELSDSYDLFFDSRERYAHLLAEAGHAEFNRLLREAWDALPMLGPNQTEASSERRRSRLAAMMRRAAGNDVEAQVEIAKKDLSTSRAFEKIAKLCLDAGQVERALTWASKGLAAFPRRDARLIQLARDLCVQLGRHDDLVQLAYGDFVEGLDVASYRALRDCCPPEKWPGWREKTVGHVEAQLQQSLRARTRNRWPKFADGSLLVEMMLVEGDVRAAQEAAQKFGCAKLTMAKIQELRGETGS